MESDHCTLFTLEYLVYFFTCILLCLEQLKQCFQHSKINFGLVKHLVTQLILVPFSLYIAMMNIYFLFGSSAESVCETQFEAQFCCVFGRSSLLCQFLYDFDLNSYGYLLLLSMAYLLLSDSTVNNSRPLFSTGTLPRWSLCSVWLMGQDPQVVGFSCRQDHQAV